MIISFKSYNCCNRTTYNPPSEKTMVTAIFWRRVIFSRQTIGTGISKIITSSTKAMLPIA